MRLGPAIIGSKQMTMLKRLFQKSNHANDGPLVANPDIEEPLSLQVVFAEPKLPDPEQLLEALRSSSINKKRALRDGSRAGWKHAGAARVGKARHPLCGV